MAFTAGYWALYKFKPHIIYYKGCDMVYKGEKTHFYGKGTADPLRKDKTLKNLLAKSARLEAIALLNNCKIFNLSNLSASNLTFKKININNIEDGFNIKYKRLNENKIDLALRMEKETGYYIPDGKYWKKMNEFDEKKIKKIDDLWLSSVEKI